jgi:hypothetical protein
MAHKIVLDLDIETTGPNEVARYLESWYEPGSSHQTTEGVDYHVLAVNVSYEGEVDGF